MLGWPWEILSYLPTAGFFPVVLVLFYFRLHGSGGSRSRDLWVAWIFFIPLIFYASLRKGGGELLPSLTLPLFFFPNTTLVTG